MTTILVDTKAGVVYSDSQTTTTSFRHIPFTEREVGHNTTYCETTTKIYVNNDTVVGAAGNSNLCSRLKQAILDQTALPSISEGQSASAISITRIGKTIKTVRYTSVEEKKWFGLWYKRYFKVEEVDPQIRYLAVGSGKQYILGAVLAGASIKQAFRGVYKNDNGSGGTVVGKTFDFKEAKAYL